jgi:hypothetical protein
MLREKLELAPDTKLGIDVGTESLSVINSSQFYQESELLEKLVKFGNLHVIFLPLNCFTYSKAFKIAEKLKNIDSNFEIDIIATELLRASPLSPAWIGAAEGSRIPDITGSIEKFQRAMDACMQLEKRYIEKVYIIGSCICCKIKSFSLTYSFLLSFTSFLNFKV